MPTTINGIGTHYYGKKNRETRQATCQQCGHATALDSYDTRLWFVIVFIPVIPLGRKRIIDQCATCQRHWAVSQDSWEMQKQLSVSGALDRFESDPTPDAALEAHAYLLSFRQHDKAQEFMLEVLEQFPDDAYLQARLAAQLEHDGRTEDADRLFTSAYELQPDMPEARVGIARGRMRAGRLDEARELMSFLEEPGSSQLYDLGPLNELAFYYQQGKQHDKTLDICRHLLAEFPNAAQQQSFRAFVVTSEKAIRANQSILPSREFSFGALFSPHSGRYEPWQRWAVFGTVLALVLAIGFLIHNEYRRRHRIVHVFNETGTPLSVTLDDQSPVSVTSRSALVVSEGRHHVQVTGAFPEEFEIELATGYFERWTKKPTWILNPGNAAAFLRTTVHYAANPQPSQGELFFGPFHYFPHIDYRFESAPNSMSLSSKRDEITKIQLEQARLPASELFYAALLDGDRVIAFDFAEAAIRRQPDDQPLLDLYGSTALANDNRDRAVTFLSGSLWTMPLPVPLHRVYQQLIGGDDERERQLIDKYDELLSSDSLDAGTLYLRGRIEPVNAVAVRFFQRSTEADPQLPWGWFALAYQAGRRGEWLEAKRFAERACEAAPYASGFQAQLHQARLALGELEQLESQYRSELELPLSTTTAMSLVNLCEVLVAAGKQGEVQTVLDSWINQYPIQSRTDEGVRAIVDLVAYMRADFADDLADFDNWMPEYKYHALLAAGRSAEAADNNQFATQRQQSWNALGLSLAFFLDGEEQKGTEWLDKAIAAFERGDRNEQLVAAILRSEEVPADEQFDNVTVFVGQRALLVALLGQRFPVKYLHFLEQAAQLNVSRGPPYHLVARAVHAASSLRDQGAAVESGLD